MPTGARGRRLTKGVELNELADRKAAFPSIYQRWGERSGLVLVKGFDDFTGDCVVDPE